MTNPSDPVYPQVIPVLVPRMTTKEGNEVATGMSDQVGTQFIPGLSKRELFAVMAMEGMLANTLIVKHIDNQAVEKKISASAGLCQLAWAYADTFIEEGNKGEPK